MTPAQRTPARFQRSLAIAYWSLPALFCLTLYWRGLGSWFQLDDFAWLQLHTRFNNWRDFIVEVFRPAQHGTFRPFSERLYFWILGGISPLDVLPFRVVAYLTQVANLLLLAAVARRVTGSRVAGFCAPVFWISNYSLVTAMAWTSAYMQILCMFCLLSAFWCFLKYIETGERRYFRVQWAVFLFGFGVMETNLVYPFLAGTYAWLFSRRHVKSLLPLAAVSVVFAVLHSTLVPKQVSGFYSMHFDAGMVRSLLVYLGRALSPNLTLTLNYAQWRATAVLVAAALAAGGYLLWAVLRGVKHALFSAAWFFITLGPVLPLQNHISDYYLTIPVAGLAMLVAGGVGEACRYGPRWGVPAVLIAAPLFCWLPAKAASAHLGWWVHRGRRVQSVVLGAMAARRLHPDKTVVLAGIGGDLYWAALRHQPFVGLGINNVFVAPDAAGGIEPAPEPGDLAGISLSADLLAAGLRRGVVAVYDTSGPRLRNITTPYQSEFFRRYSGRIALPRALQLSAIVTDALVGPTWYQAEDGHRWMPARASVRLGGPLDAKQRLYLAGYCPPGDPLRVELEANGTSLGAQEIVKVGAPFELQFQLPLSLIGVPEMELEIILSRTYRAPADPRELGLAFTTIEVR